MVICSCHAVSDRTVRAAIADGHTSLTGLMLRCGAGTSCGGCIPELERLIAEHAPAPVGAVGAVA